MKVTQNVERFGFRLEFAMQTIDAYAHKLISESPEMEVQVRDSMANAGETVLELLDQEMKRRFPGELR